MNKIESEEIKRVFVTGGTGFVGKAVITELLSRSYSITALANHGQFSSSQNAKVIKGDLFNSGALWEGMRDCQAVIHLVGIIAEQPSKGVTFQRIHVDGTKAIVDATKKAGIARYIHMSALGSRPHAASTYHQTKYEAEQYVVGSGLDYTIIRPSLIHGPEGAFMKTEVKWARKTAPPFFAMPYFGAGWLGRGGAGMLQPVFVNDVARAFVDALENSTTCKQIYPLGGSEQLTWPQMHETVATKITGHRRLILPFPVPIAKFYAAIGLGKLLNFNRDQIIMSQEDNTCDLTKFQTDFGWTPLAFESSLQNYVSEMK